MAYCGKCGTQLSEGAKFCPKCGNPCGNSSSQSLEGDGLEKQTKKLKIPTKVILAVCLALAVICGVAYYCFDREDYSLEGLAKACSKYDFTGDFHDGLAWAYDTKNEKKGFIDKSGNLIIPLAYLSVEDFSEGLAAVHNDGKVGFIDKKGTIIVPFKDMYHGRYSEGLVYVSKNDKYGYLDKSGNEVIPFIYDEATNFSEGLAAVQKDGKYGYIDKSGEEVIPFKFDMASSFSEGLARVFIKGESNYGYIDRTGKLVIPYGTDALDFCDGRARTFSKGKQGFIDKSGKEIISTIYSLTDNFSEGLACVLKDNKYGFIDKNGKEVILCQYEEASHFSEGLARVKKGGLNGYIDKSGNVVIPFIYDDGCDFSEGLARVTKDGVRGYIDKKGKSTFDYKDKAAISQESNRQTEQIQPSAVKEPSVNNSQEERPSMQNDEEFKQKTMEYVNQVQQVMVEMNNVFNSGRAFASSDLLDLKIKGDNIFDKMISLARQKKYQEAIDAFKQEKKNFDDQWHEMDKILNRDIYN